MTEVCSSASSTQSIEELTFLHNGQPAHLPGFDPHFAGWIRSMRSSGKSTNTEMAYVRGLAKCIAVLSEVIGEPLTIETFSKLKRDTLREMQVRMKRFENALAKTLVVRCAALRSLAKHLHFGCGIRCDEILLSRWDNKCDRLSSAPSAEDCTELLEAGRPDTEQVRWEQLRDLALFHLILDKALPITECLNLTRADIDPCPDDQESKFIGNDGLDPFTAGVLAEYWEACPHQIDHDTPAFVSTRGTRLHIRSAQQSIERLRNRVGLHERVTARALRNASILRMRADGRPDVEILRLTGLQTTKHLARLVAEEPIDYRVIDDATLKARLQLAPDQLSLDSTPDTCDQHTRSRTQSNSTDSGRRPRPRGKAKKRGRVQDDDPIVYDYIKQLPETLITHSATVRQFARFMRAQRKEITEATRADVVNFEADRSRHFKQNTVAKDHAALVHMFTFLFDRGVLTTVPTIGLAYPVAVKKPIAASASLVQRWVGKLEEYIETGGRLHRSAIRAAGLIALLGLEGLKIGEALWLPNDLAQVRAAHPGFCGHTIQALTRVIQRNPTEAEFLFCGRLPGRPTDPQNARLWIRDMASELDLEHAYPEAFTQAFRRAYLAVHPDLHALAQVVRVSTPESLTYDFQEIGGHA